jgi:ComF family protein
VPSPPVLVPTPNPQSLIPVLNGFLAAVLAPPCAACGAVLEAPLSGCVCSHCWRSISPVEELVFGDDAPLSRLISIGSYEGALRDVIHALKYQGRRSIASHLAMLMRNRANVLLCDADFVIPVPLHWRREYARGFNQARDIAGHLGVPMLHALRRHRATVPQVELSAEQRQANVRHAFTLKRSRVPPGMLNGCRVILVDDVATTGATLQACATVIRAAGAKDVCGLTAALKM